MMKSSGGIVNAGQVGTVKISAVDPPFPKRGTEGNYGVPGSEEKYYYYFIGIIP